MKATFAAAALTLWAGAAQALPSKVDLPHVSGLRKRWGMKAQADVDIDLIGNGTFSQQLDHKDPSQGTFKQRYWWDASNWKGKGSPVFLFNAGEDDADGYLGYLKNTTLPGLYAQQFGGAVVVIEHRYWGESIPFTTLTAETLQYHDLPNAISDMTNFAKNVKIDFDEEAGGATADETPWILMGGSYSGALAAWVQQKDPGVFWAYHASSAVVESITHFWQYYAPIEEALPRNCSADVKAVVGYVDSVLAGGDADAILALKTQFGLGQLDHHDDFAEQLAYPVSRWQEKQELVYQFCDYLETSSSGSVAGEEGVGLEAALPRYAKWVSKTVGEICQEYNCDTYAYPDSFNTPDDLASSQRQWDWLLCHNPFSWWQTGPDESDGSNIVSVFNTAEHWQRQCPLRFPNTNGFVSGSEEGFTAEHLNIYTNGWDGAFERVLFVNGQFDPWKSATVSSAFRPGGPLESTDLAPVFEIANGIHCPELVIGETAEALDQYADMFAIMEGWLSEWTPSEKV